MKYSIGMSDMRKMPNHGNSSRRVNSNHGSLSSYNIFKKYNNRNVSKKVRGKERKPMKPKVKKILYIAVGVIFFLGCLGLLGVGIYLKNLQKTLLASVNELSTRDSSLSTQIYDRNGTLLYTVYDDKNREFVSIDKIPEKTRWAVIAAEDIDFYQHKGIDYKSIISAAIRNLTSGSITGGASTITQQLVRNTILYDLLGDKAYEQTYTRKIKEILVTMQVEQTYTKDEILQKYMNEVPLGGVNYGFQAAAKAYFGKDVSELDLAESAMLAGIIQSPSVYSPLYGTNPDLAKDRQTYVLDQMLKHKDLTGVTEEEVAAAKEETLVYNSAKTDIKAPHFVLYVKQLLEEEYGTDRVERGGLKVTTTLDYSLQQMAEEEVAEGVSNAKSVNVNNGAMVVLDPNNGQILAMVGSVDYWETDDPRVDGNVNITLSERQMGSSIKPFVYLTAIEQGYGPWTEAPDLKEISFGTYDPKNWDSKNIGTMTARKALVYSRNVPAVYTLQLVGIDNFLKTAETVGITSLADKADYGLSLALGSGEETLLEHATAYSVLANGGTKYDNVSILKVEDSDGNVLEEYTEPTGTRVYPEADIYLVNWMLCDLGGFGDRPDAAYYKINGSKICGKTGTTDGPKDLTTILYDKSLVVAVWNGNNNGEVAPGAWGTTVPLRIANNFLKRVIDTYPAGTYSRPSGVLSTKVCTDTGATPADGVSCTTEASVYKEGSAPPTDNRTTVEVCTSNGLIPTNLSAAQRYGLTTSKVVLSTTLANTQQQSVYEKYLLGLKKSKYLLTTPSTGTCPLPLGTDNAPLVDVEAPTSGQNVEKGSSLRITGSVAFLESITDFEISFDGDSISGATMNSDGSFDITYTVPASTSTGAHTVTVYAKDNYSKTATTSVSVNVVPVGYGITLKIDNPTNGATITMPTNISVTVSGGTLDSVTFVITKGGTTYVNSTDSNSADGWVYIWNSSVSHGTYTITVTGTKGSTTISGDSITVTY